MYTGSLQQLQMIQQAEFAQRESVAIDAPATAEPTHPISRPLILTIAQKWETLWQSLAHRRSQEAARPGRRHQGTARPGRPRAV